MKIVRYGVLCYQQPTAQLVYKKQSALRFFISISSWCNNSDEMYGSVEEEDVNADIFLKFETGKLYSIVDYT